MEIILVTPALMYSARLTIKAILRQLYANVPYALKKKVIAVIANEKHKRIRAFASDSCAVKMTLFLHRGIDSYLLILLSKAISRNS